MLVIMFYKDVLLNRMTFCNWGECESIILYNLAVEYFLAPRNNLAFSLLSLQPDFSAISGT